MKRKLKKSKIVMRTIEVKKAPKELRWVIDPETGKKYRVRGSRCVRAGNKAA